MLSDKVCWKIREHHNHGMLYWKVSNNLISFIYHLKMEALYLHGTQYFCKLCKYTDTSIWQIVIRNPSTFGGEKQDRKEQRYPYLDIKPWRSVTTYSWKIRYSKCLPRINDFKSLLIIIPNVFLNSWNLNIQSLQLRINVKI